MFSHTFICWSDASHRYHIESSTCVLIQSGVYVRIYTSETNNNLCINYHYRQQYIFTFTACFVFYVVCWLYAADVWHERYMHVDHESSEVEAPLVQDRHEIKAGKGYCCTWYFMHTYHDGSATAVSYMELDDKNWNPQIAIHCCTAVFLSCSQRNNLRGAATVINRSVLSGVGSIYICIDAYCCTMEQQFDRLFSLGWSLYLLLLLDFRLAWESECTACCYWSG